RVLLVDCDLGLANVDVQLGLSHEVDLTRVVMGEVRLSHAIQQVDGLGLDVLPGRSGTGYLGGLDPLMVGWLQGELRSLCNRYDVVILDLPSGIEQGVRELMRRADEEIVVTTGEPTALTDAYSLIKATRRDRLDGVPKIVVNFAEHAAAGRQTLEGLVRVCERFLAVRPGELGVIRRDKRVPEAIGRQAPLLLCYPGCDAARDVIAIAEAFVAAKGLA
ncbi:MAG: cellulose synthase operon protein YhjQ/BcsQ, partial [Geminicoccaceae bacterium]